MKNIILMVLLFFGFGCSPSGNNSPLGNPVQVVQDPDDNSQDSDLCQLKIEPSATNRDIAIAFNKWLTSCNPTESSLMKMLAELER